MSDPVIIAVITVLGAPILAALVAVVRGLYSDNRASWRERAEASEAREKELKDELLPATKSAVEGVRRLADGQEQDRELYRRIEPTLRNLEGAVERLARQSSSASQASPSEEGRENERV